MAATPVTPQPGLVTEIETGGDAVTVVAGGPNGGFITNPATATEPLYINPINAAALAANGTTFALAPGQTWNIIPGQTTPTSANASTAGHQFSAIFY
jgi:hypothetical protein